MISEKFNITSKEYLEEIKDAEKKMIKFLTHYLFKAIGTSKTLIIARGVNSESFGKAVASLSGYIKRNSMDIKIMTILSSQSFA